MANVDVNGVLIEYAEWGSGPPLLLVMGLGGQLTDWPAEFVDGLAQRFRVVAFDNRDIGLSSETTGPIMSTSAMLRTLLTRRKPESGYVLADMADDAVGLLDALDVDSAHVLGISMGGMIAQTMAIHHRQRVKSMVSIMSNTGHRRKGRSSASLLVKLARRPKITRDNALEEIVEVAKMISSPGLDEDELRRLAKASIERSFRPEGAVRQFTAIAASPDRTDELRTVTAPTLVVHGLLDELVVPSGGIATAEAVPGSRLLMFPDMAHDLPRRRWAELVDAVLANAGRAASVS
ncbi:MAG: alpha/beta fold hydrolase [Acidimicrobiales bacterium]